MGKISRNVKAWPGIVIPKVKGLCHEPKCLVFAEEDRGFCRDHLAARLAWAREHGAEIVKFSDYERDPETGRVKKKS